MADVLISGIPAAAALSTSDLFEVEQGVVPTSTSGKTTLGAIRTFVTPVLTVTTLSISAGVVNVDLALGDYFTLALTANVTSITFSNLPTAGIAKSFSVRFRQDGTGGRTVAFPASFKATGGSDTSVASTANIYSLFVATSFDQGTRWEYALQEVAA